MPSSGLARIRSGPGKEINLSTNNENPNFFDSRTVMAIILVAGTFMGWQYYMQAKYPDAFKKKAAATASDKTSPQSPAVENKENPGVVDPVGAVSVKSETLAPVVDKVLPESLIPFENENLAFQISSKGMGLKNFMVRKYKDRTGQTIDLGHPGTGTLALETRLMGSVEALDFKIEKVSDNIYVGRARLEDLEITKTMEVMPGTYVLKFKVATRGFADRFIGLSTMLGEEVEEVPSGSFLIPQFAHQEFFVDAADGRERVYFAKEDIQKNWNKVKVAAVGSQYFTQAIVDSSPVMPEAKASLNHVGKAAEVQLLYPILNKTEGLTLEYTAFMGPKSHHLLVNVDENLSNVVDFGFFNWIGRQILAMLKWFYALCGNWGVAVILLTVVVRIMVLPFNVYSYKSMKKMQEIQPQIASLRERYKDDQQKQQQEMMTLMRENKVNPVGGCLPVLLQFPIFIALYQVLGTSIELYQAPFTLWIHDLSLKDPFYILPVLMGVTMFIQQKITPNTMDPTQAKILLFMPLIFTFFMVTLPSGLTLYMWVGALFSVLQQLYFMRDQKPVTAVVKV
jgi:YidC/Oxa1 family membrane protein insertase